MKQKIITLEEQHIGSDYFKMPTKKFVNKWSKIAKSNRRGEIPESETQKQAQNEIYEAKLRIDFEHKLITTQEEAILNHQQEKLRDLKENFHQYVEAEKAKLSERMFKRIDRLKKPVDILKDKIEEFKQGTSLK